MRLAASLGIASWVVTGGNPGNLLGMGGRSLKRPDMAEKEAGRQEVSFKAHHSATCGFVFFGVCLASQNIPAKQTPETYPLLQLPGLATATKYKPIFLWWPTSLRELQLPAMKRTRAGLSRRWSQGGSRANWKSWTRAFAFEANECQPERCNWPGRCFSGQLRTIKMRERLGCSHVRWVRKTTRRALFRHVAFGRGNDLVRNGILQTHATSTSGPWSITSLRHGDLEVDLPFVAFVSAFAAHVVDPGHFQKWLGCWTWLGAWLRSGKHGSAAEPHGPRDRAGSQAAAGGPVARPQPHRASKKVEGGNELKLGLCNIMGLSKSR